MRVHLSILIRAEAKRDKIIRWMELRYSLCERETWENSYDENCYENEVKIEIGAILWFYRI